MVSADVSVSELLMFSAALLSLADGTVAGASEIAEEVVLELGAPLVPPPTAEEFPHPVSMMPNVKIRLIAKLLLQNKFLFIILNSLRMFVLLCDATYGNCYAKQYHQPAQNPVELLIDAIGDTLFK